MATKPGTVTAHAHGLDLDRGRSGFLPQECCCRDAGQGAAPGMQTRVPAFLRSSGAVDLCISAGLGMQILVSKALSGFPS